MLSDFIGPLPPLAFPSLSPVIGVAQVRAFYFLSRLPFSIEVFFFVGL